jgi:hypothetical protein
MTVRIPSTIPAGGTALTVPPATVVRPRPGCRPVGSREFLAADVAGAAVTATGSSCRWPRVSRFGVHALYTKTLGSLATGAAGPAVTRLRLSSLRWPEPAGCLHPVCAASPAGRLSSTMTRAHDTVAPRPPGRCPMVDISLAPPIQTARPAPEGTGPCVTDHWRSVQDETGAGRGLNAAWSIAARLPASPRPRPASRRRPSMLWAIWPTHSMTKPTTMGASMAASAAWPRTCESWSGGPVSRPAVSTHTITVRPALAPDGAGTVPVCRVASGAVHLARTVA